MIGIKGDSMRHRSCGTLAFVVAVSCLVQAADRSTITFADGRIFPESLTSTRNGDIYFGALGQEAVYRAAKNSSVATVWVKPKTAGLQQVLGVFADEPAGVLWVCTSATGGQNGAPLVGETALKAFSLKDASLKGSYPFPGNGLCNDIAVAKDGTVYATDTTQGRILRLKKGAAALDVWLNDPMPLGFVDGIALLADGSVYVNSVRQNTLMRIPVKADGSAGPIAMLTPSQPVMGPDGMRSVGSRTMLLVEGGRLDEVTIDGDKAQVRVLKDGMEGITAVTLSGDTAYLSEARLNARNQPADPGPFRALSVPYKAPK
jgi:sugar lactone lactonase YvrE